MKVVVNNPNLRPSPLANPLVNIQNAPAAPDPQGYAALLQTLGNPDIFKDLTGLNQTQLNALQSMLSAQNNAQKYAQTAAKLSAAAMQLKAYDDLSKAVDEDKTLSPAEKKAKKDDIYAKKEGTIADFKVTPDDDTFDNFVDEFERTQKNAGAYGKSYHVKAEDKYGNKAEVKSEGGGDYPLDKPRNVYVIEDGWNGGQCSVWNSNAISANVAQLFTWVQQIIQANPLFSDVSRYLFQTPATQDLNHHVIYVFANAVINPRSLPDADIYNATPDNINRIFTLDIPKVNQVYGQIIAASPQILIDFCNLGYPNNPLPTGVPAPPPPQPPLPRSLPNSAFNNRNYSFILLPLVYNVSPAAANVFPPNEIHPQFIGTSGRNNPQPNWQFRMQSYAIIHELLAHINYRGSLGKNSPSGIPSMGNPNHTENNNAWAVTGQSELALISAVNTFFNGLFGTA
ncbi:MAG: hypothetical protein ACKVTZ_20655 [Bacteroidia bacterium]